MKYPIRSMYIPPPGYKYIAADLSQAETWIVAYLAGEDGMKDALMNGDIHSRTAALFYGKTEEYIISIKNTQEGADMRYGGKKGNHSLAYRTSPSMLMLSYNENSDKPPYRSISLNQATRFFNLWHGYYKAIKPWWATIEADLAKNQRTLITPYGRKRRFFNYWGEELFKEATAFIPQSTVADHALGLVQDELGIEGGLYSIWKETKKYQDIKIVQTAHDSVVLECPENLTNEWAEIVKSKMARPVIVNNKEVNIPVDISILDRLK